MKVNLNLDFSTLSKGLILTESPLNPKRHRERLVTLAFEHFDVPRFQLTMNSLNALYSEAQTTGLVLESGEGLTTCVPIVDGYVIQQGIQRIDVGGRDVNEYLMEILKPKVMFTNTFEREFVRDIKEQCCYVKQKVGH